MQFIKLVGGSIGTNCYLLEENDKVILFDYVPEALEYVSSNNYTPEKIFLTHVHYDHFEGLYNFLDKYDVELYMSDAAYSDINNDNITMRMITPHANKKISLVNSKKCLNDDLIIWNNLEIKVFSSPGHSRCSVIYIIDKLKVVISGDTLFKMGVGRCDLPGGSQETMIQSITTLFNNEKINDYRVFPGHGPETTVEYEKQYNPFCKGNVL